MSFLNLSMTQSVRWWERWNTVAARTACRRSGLRSRSSCALIRVPSAASSSKTLAGMRSINVVGRFRDGRKRMCPAILSRFTAVLATMPVFLPGKDGHAEKLVQIELPAF